MSDHILTTLLSFCVCVSIASILGLRPPFRMWKAGVALAALAALAATVALGSQVPATGNYLSYLIRDFRSFNKGQFAAAGLGAALSLLWLVRSGRGGESESEDRRAWLESAAKILSLTLAIGCAFVYARSMRQSQAGVQGLESLEPGYVAEEVAKFDNSPPLRIIATDTGRILMTVEKADSGFSQGSILELTPQSNGASGTTLKILATGPLLYRSFGLAVRGDVLYVSRSNHIVRSTKGEMTFEPAGAITELRDLDGDGYYEYADDVVVDLPGVSGVNSQHQNNALLFGPDGRVYVSQGAGSNDREASVKEWEGKVLSFDPDFSNPRIFASGFRNPFGMCFGPDAELFAVDNDVNLNPGDELNHVIQGEHYGHPFVLPKSNGGERGFRDPIYLSAPESNLVGIAYGASDKLPERLKGCLFIADRVKNVVLRLRLVRDGDTYKVEEESILARVPEPVDVAVTPDGVFYVTSYQRQAVYRIRPVASPK